MSTDFKKHLASAIEKTKGEISKEDDRRAAAAEKEAAEKKLRLDRRSALMAEVVQPLFVELMSQLEIPGEPSVSDSSDEGTCQTPSVSTASGNRCRIVFTLKFENGENFRANCATFLSDGDQPAKALREQAAIFPLTLPPDLSRRQIEPLIVTTAQTYLHSLRT